MSTCRRQLCTALRDVVGAVNFAVLAPLRLCGRCVVAPACGHHPSPPPPNAGWDARAHALAVYVRTSMRVRPSSAIAFLCGTSTLQCQRLDIQRGETGCCHRLFGVCCGFVDGGVTAGTVP